MRVYVMLFVFNLLQKNNQVILSYYVKNRSKVNNALPSDTRANTSLSVYARMC